jgi:cytochrome c oxidase subunit IV
MSTQDKSNDTSHEVHIVSYKEHASTFLALALLTIMTFTISTYGAELYTLTVLTALLIASTKATVVAWYFMHLKYEPKVFRVMIAAVLILFISFAMLTLVDYAVRK